FLSCEPLLGSLYPEPSAIKLGPTNIEVIGGPLDGLRPKVTSADISIYDGRRPLNLDGIDWVIVGGESGGRDARPMHPRGARELRDAVIGLRNDDMLKAAFGSGPRFHFKQWGSWKPNPAARSDSGSMIYAGENPKAGGKLLDGVDWCEFPERRDRVTLQDP